MKYPFETIKPKKYPKPSVIGDLTTFSKDFESSSNIEKVENHHDIGVVEYSAPALVIAGYLDTDGNYYNTKQFILLTCKKNLEPVFRLKAQW